MNPVNPINPMETEFFGISRIDSDRPDSFRLKVQIDRIDRIHSDSKFGLILINSNWTDSFGFILVASSDWFWMSLGLIRIEN